MQVDSEMEGYETCELNAENRFAVCNIVQHETFVGLS